VDQAFVVADARFVAEPSKFIGQLEGTLEAFVGTGRAGDPDVRRHCVPVQMAEPSASSDLRERVHKTQELVVQPRRRGQIGSNVKPRVRDFDAHMRQRREYRSGGVQRTGLPEPFVDDNEFMLDAGRMAGMAFHEATQRGRALRMPRQIRQRNPVVGWHSRRPLR